MCFFCDINDDVAVNDSIWFNFARTFASRHPQHCSRRRRALSMEYFDRPHQLLNVEALELAHQRSSRTTTRLDLLIQRTFLKLFLNFTQTNDTRFSATDNPFDSLWILLQSTLYTFESFFPFFRENFFSLQPILSISHRLLNSQLLT